MRAAIERSAMRAECHWQRRDVGQIAVSPRAGLEPEDGLAFLDRLGDLDPREVGGFNHRRMKQAVEQYRTQRLDAGQRDQRGKSSVTDKRNPQPCGPPSGPSTQYRTPPPKLTSWSPTFVTLETVALIGTAHCSRSQS